MTAPQTALRQRGPDRRSGVERRGSPTRWSGRDRRSGLDRRKGERRRGFGRRAGALAVDRRFPASTSAVPRARVLVESGVVVVVLAAVAMTIGLELLDRDIVPEYAIGALAEAWSVWHPAPDRVGTIGYERPPLLSILEVPLAFDTRFTQELVLLPAVSVITGAVLAGGVHAVLAGMRVPFLTRTLATVLLVLNPAWVYFTASGLPTVGGMLCALVGIYGMVNWLRFRNLLWALVSSCSLALGMLSWYPVTAWAIGAVLLLLAANVRERRPAVEVLGVMLVYVLPLAFAAGLWTLLSVRATGAVPPWLTGAPAEAGLAMSAGDFTMLLTPLVLAVAIAVAVYAPRRGDVVGAGVVLFLVIPLFIALVRARVDRAHDAGAGSLFFVMLPSVAIVVTASVYNELGRRVRVLTSVVLAACLLAGNVLLWDWMADGAGRPVNDFANVIEGTATTSAPPDAIEIGRWLRANAYPSQVAVAEAVPVGERKLVALMAGMPKLIVGGGNPHWLLLPARDLPPRGYRTVLVAGSLAVVER